MALPPQFNMSTLTGTYVTINGDPLVGKQLKLTFAPEALVVAAADTIIIPDVQVITLDTAGHFSVSVPDPTDPDVNPNQWTYQVQELFGAQRHYSIEFSGPGPHDMSDLAPVAAAPGVSVIGSFITAVGSAAQPVTSASTARPSGTGVVYWLCAAGVTPTNAVNGDLIWNAS